MAINRVRYGSQTLIDLTNDTITPESLLSGITAHGKDGETIVGTMTTQVFRTGTTVPNDYIGDNGDLYFKIER